MNRTEYEQARRTCNDLFRANKSINSVKEITGLAHGYVSRLHKAYQSRKMDAIISKGYNDGINEKLDNIKNIEKELWEVMGELNKPGTPGLVSNHYEMKFQDLKKQYAKFCL